MHGTVSRRLADGISPRPPFAWPSPKNVLFISAANTQKDITHREIALRRKAPVRNYIARSVQFVNVHHLAAPDAIAGSGVRTHDFKLVQSVPLLRLLWAQPGTKKSKAPLFNFGAVDRYR